MSRRLLHFPLLSLFIQLATCSLHFRIPEELPAGTPIGSIPIRPNSRYRLTENHGFFGLNSTTGQISLIKKIDRDVLLKDTFELIIVNQEQSAYPISVSVQITDINDNAPVFPQSLVNITFLETDQIGQRILLQPAKDNDGPIASYSIISGDKSGKFRLIKTDAGKQHFLHIENTAVLDRETKPNYLLNISATDTAKPAKSGYFLLNITLGDANDCSPIFDLSEYVVSLSEKVEVNAAVLKVHASDNDEPNSANSKIIYSLANTSVFSIDQTGIIRTNSPKTTCPKNKCPSPDCPQTCVLTVEARDSGEPFLTGRAYVYITLIDENDHSPEITFRYYPSTSSFATVAEDASNGTTVAVVSVRDLDEGLNGQVKVSISGGNSENFFRIDPVQSYLPPRMQLAYLKLNGKLDRSRVDKYNLTVTAVDTGHPSLNSSKSLLVIVSDVNDYSPVFEKANYEALINESVPVGSFVEAVFASDADGAGINGKVIYSIVAGNEHHWLHINSDTGLITTMMPLDREVASSLRLNVSARDSAPNPKMTFATLFLQILDTNDNAPFLTNCPKQNFLVKENIPIGTQLFQLSATDNDAGQNAKISFKLDHDSFTINEITGQLTVQGTLDFERQSRHVLRIIAVDHGHPSQSSACSVTVELSDENDHRPVFSPVYYNVPLEQNKLTAGHKITVVSASDGDLGGSVKYSLLDSSHNGISLDESTGKIWSNREINLAEGEMIKLQITAKDNHGLTAENSAIVYIFPAVQTPNFRFEKAGPFFVQEDSRSPIGKLRLTETFTGVQYFITGGPFFLDSATGTLTATKPLNYEEASFYRLNVSAWKSPYFTTTTVDINVEDVNDNAPVIKNLKGQDAKMDIPVSFPLGQEIFVIDGHDAEKGPLTYSMKSDILAVNRTSGSVYLRRPLNPSIDTVKFTVRVTDAGNLSTAADGEIRVILEKCRNAFKRGKYKIFVPEDIRVNSRLMTAELEDCRNETARRLASYRIPSGNDLGYFGVLPDGQLYVNATLADRAGRYYPLEIEAWNGDSAALTSVLVRGIDVNNGSPLFANQSYSFGVDENTPVGRVVGRVYARDNDTGLNGQVEYRISNVSFSKLFEVDPDSGVIRSVVSFDRENLSALSSPSGTFTFPITASDRPVDGPIHTSTTTVHVMIRDQNDNSPVFSQKLYHQSIPESASIFDPILQVTAHDADSGANGELLYSLQCPEDCLHVFAIDALTGFIRLNQTLDFETRSRYDFLVTASDQSANHTLRQTSFAAVIVEVLDQNDEPPQFVGINRKVTLSENAPAGTFVVQMSAVNPDTLQEEEIQYAIASGNPDSVFRINRLGEIYLNHPLDYEKAQFHNLTVVARKKNAADLTASSFVIVTVQDANDNAPRFSDLIRTTITVSENISPGSVVATILANDDDTGLNGEIRYSILYSEPVNGHFKINTVSGQITTEDQLDREKIASYRLVLRAEDQSEMETDRLSSEKVITVMVEDVNDNVAIFTNPRSVIVPRDAASGYRLFTVSAQDSDSEKNGQIVYDLTKNADMERFHLDRYQGHVYLRGDIARIAPIYSLTIQANDQDSKNLVTTTVDLVVVSGTGNKNVAFSSSIYEWTVYENHTVGEPIGTVSATSLVSRFASVEYFLTGVTGLNGAVLPCNFDVDSRNGRVTLGRGLDADQVANGYLIQIYARVKSFAGYEVTTSQIRLKVLSVNNRSPVFASPFYRFRLEPGMQIGAKLGQVAASDLDREDFVTYSIKQAPGNEFFRISPTSGELWIKTLPVNISRVCFPITAGDSVHESEVSCCVEVVSPAWSTPIFTQEKYAFTVLVDVLEDGEQIGAVSVMGTAERYVYHQASDWFTSSFHVDRRTGAISVPKASFLRDIPNEGRTAVLQIDAADPVHFSYPATAMVYIRLLRNTSLHQQREPISVTLSENAPVGLCFLDVYQTEPPQIQDGHEPLIHINGDDSDQFSLTQQGLLCVASPLDRETQPIHNLTIVVKSAVYRTTYPVTVTLDNVNDEAPVFSPSVPEVVLVSELSPVGMLIFQAAASDRDDDAPLELQFALEPELEEFSMEAGTGAVELRKQLHFDKMSEYTLSVVVSDKGTPPLSSTATVTVLVLGENQSSPKFSQKAYQADVSESTRVGSSVLSVSAADGDSGRNGDLRYWIVDGNGEDVFDMDGSTGKIFLKGPLDFERRTAYDLLVKVEDGGLLKKNDTARVVIHVLNENDESPRFPTEKFQVHVQENYFEQPRLRLIQMIAQDADAPPFNNVSYRIHSGDFSLFHLDEHDGWISLKRALDREEKHMHQIQVEASNAGSPTVARATLTVVVEDENDNAPAFSGETKFSIMENSKNGSFVGRISASDADENATISFRLLDGSPFRIDNITGAITTASIIDREMVSRYNLSVQVSDGLHLTNGTLSVFVADQDDSSPYFAQKNAMVHTRDNLEKGSFVYPALALDADEQGSDDSLRYRFDVSTDAFRINPRTGVITTAAAVERASLTVVVSDPVGHQDRMTVEIIPEKLGFFPVLSPGSKVFSFPETTDVIQITRVTAESLVGQPVRYRIAAGNLFNTFEMDETSGDLRRIRLFDHETASEFDLWIEAYSESQRAIYATALNVKIQIENQNDNAPQFSRESYYTELMEEAGPADVIQLTASDLDRDSLEFTLMNGTEYFAMDPKTGMLRASSSFDRETTPFLTVTVAVTDRAHSATAQVHIKIRDINDNPPKFTRQFSGNVTENTSAGTIVAEISSTDADEPENANVTYSLITNPDESFNINETTGVVRTIRSVKWRAPAEIPLEIAVRDGAWLSKSVIVIKVLREKRDTLVFEEETYQFYVQDGVPAGIAVGRVNTVGDNATYSPKESSSVFAIERATGKITTKSLLTGPRSIDRFGITVGATGSAPDQLSAQCLVWVTVLPEDVVPPRFTQSRYSVQVPWSLTAGESVVRLPLRHVEETYLPRFSWQPLKGTNDCFHLNPASGLVFAVQSADNCQSEEYHFAVSAYYTEDTSAATAELIIRLVNTTILHPDFPASRYEVSIPESSPIGNSIFTAAVSDPDKFMLAEIQYMLLNSSPEFQIDPSSGVVRLRKQLDYETTKQFSFTVGCSRYGYAAPTALTTLIVSVINENDNPPVFQKPFYQVTVPESEKVSVELGRVSAVDPDLQDQDVCYVIEPEHPSFVIDSLKGIITNTQPLDYETAPNHTLTIRALDPVDPSLFSETTFFVEVSDQNEAAPQCGPSTSSFTISAKTLPGSKIGRALGSDLDSGPAGVIEYSLVGVSSNFHIDPSTGELTLAGELGSGEVTIHVLMRNLGFPEEDTSTICNVVIRIVDGDHMPYFMQREYVTKIREDALVGTLVYTVAARTEGQTKIRYMVADGDEGGKFEIDTRSGEIRVARQLDRELVAAYSLRIVAKSTNKPEWTAAATVNITVEDVNDNAPYFDAIPVGHLRENTNHETVVLKLSAKDGDSGPHFFVYRLASPEWKAHFKIHPTSGTVTSLKPIDRETHPEITLNISVSDSGSPTKTSTVQAKIIIDDENDDPSFERPLTIVVHIADFEAPGRPRKIGNVKPADADVVGDYRCQILGHSEFTMENGCELGADGLKPGSIHRLQVQGSDGKHPPVQYDVIVKAQGVTRSQQENSIALKLAGLSAEQFLGQNYVRLMQSLYDVFGVVGQASVFALTSLDKHCVVQLAVVKESSFLSKSHVIQRIQENQKDIERRAGITIRDVDYKPCSEPGVCPAGSLCHDSIQMIPNQTSISSSSSLIIVGPLFEYFHRCTCVEPFSGPECEMQCPEDFCQNGGLCSGTGKCLCAPGFFGSQCQFDLDECNLWGSPNCFNGGKCVNTIGSFVCECPVGYDGKQCERARSRGTGEQSSGLASESFIELSPLKTTSNEIFMTLSTTDQEGLIAYSRGPARVGVAHFMALEIVKGRVVFSFGSTARDTTKITVDKVVSDGRFYRIAAVKKDLIGSLTVDDCDDSFCSVCSPGDETCSTVTVGVVRRQYFGNSSLFLGSPPSQTGSQLQARKSFTGCIKNLTINGAVITPAAFRNSKSVSESMCPAASLACEASSCAENEICVSSTEGHFQCVTVQQSSSTTLIAILVSALVTAVIVAAGILYHYRKSWMKLTKKSHRNYPRPPFMSPINVYEQAYVQGTYQPQGLQTRSMSSHQSICKSDLCVYHALQRASPHYYCVVSEKRDRPSSHYASFSVYESRDPYVSGRNALISPSGISEGPQSSVSTQPVDILSLDSVDSLGSDNSGPKTVFRRQDFQRTKGDVSDACSDCENCKVTLDYRSGLENQYVYSEQPTYAEVNDFLDRAATLRHVAV